MSRARSRPTASFERRRAGGHGPIAFAAGKKKKLVFRLGKRRSHILRHGGKIQIWIDATLGRATTKRFVHVTRVASVSLSP